MPTEFNIPPIHAYRYKLFAPCQSCEETSVGFVVRFYLDVVCRVSWESQGLYKSRFLVCSTA